MNEIEQLKKEIEQLKNDVFYLKKEIEQLKNIKQNENIKRNGTI